MPPVKNPRRLGNVGQESWWEAVKDVFAPAKSVFSVFGAVPNVYAAWWMTKYARDIRTLGALKGAWRWASAQAIPSNVTAALNSPWLKGVTKGFAVVGSVVSTAVAINTWMDPESSGWDKTRDTVSAGLAVTGTVLLFTPAAPIGAAILAVGAVWSIGSAAWDNREAIGSFVSDLGATVSNVASSAENIASDAAGSVLKAADRVLDSGANFVSSLGRGWKLGW